jgi:hypothetical protein
VGVGTPSMQRVYVASYPTFLLSPPWWNVLNQVCAAVAAHGPDVASRPIRDFGH